MIEPCSPSLLSITLAFCHQWKYLETVAVIAKMEVNDHWHWSLSLIYTQNALLLGEEQSDTWKEACWIWAVRRANLCKHCDFSRVVGWVGSSALTYKCNSNVCKHASETETTGEPKHWSTLTCRETLVGSSANQRGGEKNGAFNLDYWTYRNGLALYGEM